MEEKCYNCKHRGQPGFPCMKCWHNFDSAFEPKEKKKIKLYKFAYRRKNDDWWYESNGFYKNEDLWIQLSFTIAYISSFLYIKTNLKYKSKSLDFAKKKLRTN